MENKFIIIESERAKSIIGFAVIFSIVAIYELISGTSTTPNKLSDIINS